MWCPRIAKRPRNGAAATAFAFAVKAGGWQRSARARFNRRRCVRSVAGDFTPQLTGLPPNIHVPCQRTVRTARFLYSAAMRLLCRSETSIRAMAQTVARANWDFFKLARQSLCKSRLVARGPKVRGQRRVSWREADSARRYGRLLRLYRGAAPSRTRGQALRLRRRWGEADECAYGCPGELFGCRPMQSFQSGFAAHFRRRCA